MLLDTARIESGQSTITLEPVELGAILVDATARVVLNAEGGSVKLDTPPRLPRVRADAGRLEHALTLLLACACRRSPAGAPVRLSVRPLAHAVMVCIGDEGYAPLVNPPAEAADSPPARAAGLVELEVDAARAAIGAMAGRLFISVGAEGVSACAHLPTAPADAAQLRGSVAPGGR
jgi:hypothetical protein